MPYEIREEENQYCVYNSDTGEKKKCYPTREEAVDLMGALYAVHKVKALGDMELEVLGVPYYGPKNGKDEHGEYFDHRTKLHEDKYPLPPAVYYHGFGEDGEPMGAPEYIGKAVSFEDRSDGRWYRVILDKASAFARRVFEAAKEGLARASSGSVAHLTRIDRDGHIREWPVNELSIFDIADDRQPANSYAVAVPVMKKVYKQAEITWPDGIEPEAILGENAAESPNKKIIRGVKKMSEKVLTQADIDLAKEEARKALLAEQEAERLEEEKRQAEIKEAVDAAVEQVEVQHQEELEKVKEEAMKGRRLDDVSFDKNVNVANYAELWKYDNLSPEDQAVMIGILDAAKISGRSKKGYSPAALQALAIKLEEDKSPHLEQARSALKRAKVKAGDGALKSDEIQQQSLASYGDEFVAVAYSNALWESIRTGTFVAENIPKIEVPAGHESVVIPVEGGDPTFYKVAEATATQTSGWPNTTITSSRAGTTNKTLSLAKMGARMLWTGELEEDSIIPWVSYVRTKLQVSGAENLEHVIIDGDTATAASTNINDIGDASAQAGTEVYLLFNGFRKSCLVTTTANMRSGGSLGDTDFLETLKLMGTAGINALDIDKCAFIQDANVRWKSLEIATVKTKDVFSNPTIENGRLTGIWGYKVYTSQNMHKSSSNRKVNSAGKVDQTTTSNNTTGSILAVRWDQWVIGYRRRMTLETTRIARADTTEIVALMRLGLAQRDTEASAISYNITV